MYSTSSHTVGLSQGRLLDTSSECTMVLINWWAPAMFDNWEEYWNTYIYMYTNIYYIIHNHVCSLSFWRNGHSVLLHVVVQTDGDYQHCAHFQKGLCLWHHIDSCHLLYTALHNIPLEFFFLASLTSNVICGENFINWSLLLSVHLLFVEKRWWDVFSTGSCRWKWEVDVQTLHLFLKQGPIINQSQIGQHCHWTGEILFQA